MNRGYLALGAAAVVAALIGLYLALSVGTSDDPAADRAAPGPAHPPTIQKIAEAQAAPGKPRITPAPRSGSATEYLQGETRVRDHRAGEHGAFELNPAPPRRLERRDTAPQLSTDLAQRIRPLLRDCTASVPPEVRGDKPRVEGEVIVAIKDHQATITSAALALRDVPETAQVEARQCLARSAVGLVASAGDAADVDGYPITLSLSVP